LNLAVSTSSAKPLSKVFAGDVETRCHQHSSRFQFAFDAGVRFVVFVRAVGAGVARPAAV